jgi:hypothetical protein
MVVTHIIQRRRVLGGTIEHSTDLQFAERRYRRRMQTSALTMTLGALIVLCDYLPPVRTSPGLAAGYILIMLLLAIGLVLLAISDAMASRVHLTQSSRSIQRTRDSLRATIEEMRRKQAALFDQDSRIMTIATSGHCEEVVPSDLRL